MFENYTDRARKVLQLAKISAKENQHEYTGSEDILYGLCKEGSGIAANVLKNLGCSPAMIQVEIEKIVVKGDKPVAVDRMPWTPRVNQIFEYSKDEAEALGHTYIGTEHLLLGLLRQQEGIAIQVLTNFGIKSEDVREEVLNLLGQGKAAKEEIRHYELLRWIKDTTEKVHPDDASAILGEIHRKLSEHLK